MDFLDRIETLKNPHPISLPLRQRKAGEGEESCRSYHFLRVVMMRFHCSWSEACDCFSVFSIVNAAIRLYRYDPVGEFVLLIYPVEPS